MKYAPVQTSVVILILLSIEPEAIKLPVGSNLAAKISPECPVNSMTGACSPLVRGPYKTISFVQITPRKPLTACTRELLDALRRARALSDEFTFCLLTSIRDEPASSSAGRFSADMMTVTAE